MTQHGRGVGITERVGLTSDQVLDRVARGQANTAPRRASRGFGDIVRANVFTRFNAILGALFVVILVIGPIQDALFGFVIVANTAIGIVQEWRAKHTLDRLAILGEARPRVWRDGTITEIAADQLVCDDVIQLGPGDQLLVDGTLLDTAALEVDESLLTGEADPVAKLTDDPVLSGSFVVAGTATYRATKVGAQSYAARLAQRASRFTVARSALRSDINRLLAWIAYLFVPVAALTVYGQLKGSETVAEALRGVVAALVSMVPEGLVLLTSIAFAVGVVRLGQRRCLVQELPAIEGLARVDTVCTDKTGTLTETGMRVSAVHPVVGDITGDSDAVSALAALAAADCSPNASMRAIAAAYPDPPDWPVTATAAFSSATKWSGASFAGHGHWVLGAPDILLPATGPAAVQAEHLAATGLRVLLLGRSDRAVDVSDAPGRVQPVALVMLEQKVRVDAPATLDYFAAQGVSVKILSGDNARSVGAVATGLRLLGADHPLDAHQLSAEPATLTRQVSDTTVFGRVTPDQKARMVTALQGDGHSVAMTGDGVNDVLALKEADVGVAMGSGSPAARSVAQIVLLDNAFATLPYVVAEGRRVIGNIERVASLFLIKTVYATALALLIGAARLPFPFLPRHLTLVSTLTIGVPAFFLALAPNTAPVRRDLLRRVLRAAVPFGVIAAGTTLACYYAARAEPGTTLVQQRTAATIGLFLIALWALAVIARPFAWWKVGLVAAMAAVFVSVLLVPVTQRFFAVDPSNTDVILTPVGIAAAAVVIERLLARWRAGRSGTGPDPTE